MINNGVVITYAKLNTTNPNYLMFNKPVSLPFYFLPPWERVANTFYWYDSNTPGSLKIAYRTGSKAEKLTGEEANLQFRYFVITKEFLTAHDLDAATVKQNYTYQQIINLIGTKE
ncbi:MAG: hypothetical protein C4330_06970 [Chitinophagaceae bacterium]